jgi:hypothetical protein
MLVKCWFAWNKGDGLSKPPVKPRSSAGQALVKRAQATVGVLATTFMDYPV